MNTNAAPTATTNTIHTMLILCTKRALDSFVDELDDWKEEGVTTLLHGITGKTNGGFILMQWGKPIPARFHQKMREDEEVVDYFVLANITMTNTIIRTPPQL